MVMALQQIQHRPGRPVVCPCVVAGRDRLRRRGGAQVRVDQVEFRALAFLARRTVTATAWELAFELRCQEAEADRVLRWLASDGLVAPEGAGWRLAVPDGLERLTKLRQASDEPPEWAREW